MTQLEKRSRKGLFKIPCVGSVYLSSNYEIKMLAQFNFYQYTKHKLRLTVEYYIFVFKM